MEGRLMARIHIRYWGVRGSIPVPGPQTVRYGGNTSCLEVHTDGHRIILDAGTGLARLGASLTQPERLTLILSHLHWDHIQGFPFFGPIYRKESQIDIYTGHSADVNLEGVLKGQMQEPNFPMNMEGLPAQFSFNEVHSGEKFELPGTTVGTVALHHPNGATGFAFETGGKRFVHLTYHEHTPEYDESIITFCQGADILSLDTMYTPEQYPNHVGWGHSSWLHGTEIAKRADVRQLVLFHHNPIHDDDTLDRVGRLARQEFSATLVAYEGLELAL
jgi:phosphoribosyl 1,2-cyclic phosphodiesterase